MAVARFGKTEETLVDACDFEGWCLCPLDLACFCPHVRKTIATGSHRPQRLILRGGFVGSFKNPPRLHP